MTVKRTAQCTCTESFRTNQRVTKKKRQTHGKNVRSYAQKWSHAKALRGTRRTTLTKIGALSSHLIVER